MSRLKLHNQIPSIHNETDSLTEILVVNMFALCSPNHTYVHLSCDRKKVTLATAVNFYQPLLVNRGLSRVLFFFSEHQPQYVCSLTYKTIFLETPGN